METVIKEGRTRREFLKGAGAVVAGGVVVGVIGSQLSCEELPGAVGLKKAMGYISVVNPAHCGQCGVCEAACSLYHEGEVNNGATSRMHVLNFAPHQAFDALPITCWQCDGPECIYICEQYATSAFHVDPTTGARVIDKDLCLGGSCKLCMGACILAPNVPIRYVPEEDTLINCDLCDGNVYCAKFCPPSSDVPSEPFGPQPYIHPENAKVLKFVENMKEGADQGVRTLTNNRDGYFWGFGDGRKGFRSPNPSS